MDHKALVVSPLCKQRAQPSGHGVTEQQQVSSPGKVIGAEIAFPSVR
jgi:hypothetical protein